MLQDELTDEFSAGYLVEHPGMLSRAMLYKL